MMSSVQLRDHVLCLPTSSEILPRFPPWYCELENLEIGYTLMMLEQHDVRLLLYCLCGKGILFLLLLRHEGNVGDQKTET